MKKKLLFAAIALTAMASCTEDSFVGEQSHQEANASEGAISFNLNVPGVTRADKTGSDAAGDLGNKFYVYGIKGEASDGAGLVGATHTVFKNYVVEYGSNTAYTTTSNTKDWEYVGKALTTNEATNITANDGTGAQTIKYWDYSAGDYTFYAFSAAAADIDASSPKINVVKNQTVTTGKYLNGYTATISTGANIDKLFFSERVNITQSNGKDRTAKNTYGGNVTFRFHNAAAKVRVAMYETIDGYSVKINKFTVANDQSDPTFVQMDDDVTTNFAANLTNSKGSDAGTLTVTYYDNTNSNTENHPILSFAKTDGANKVLTLGTNLIDVTELATTIATPTYDTGDDTSTSSTDENGSYTSMYPNKDNNQNLKLKLTYTLTAPGTGETIVVQNATAEIPSNYLQWKPGFAYTYIFKISANTNGSTGQDVVGLYPITFDAVSTISEDGQAEYITTVSEPSITTFGAIYNTTSPKYTGYQTDKSDYQAQNTPNRLDVFATIMDGSSVVTPVEGDGAGKVNYYSIDYKSGATADDKLAYPITEASVAETIAESANSSSHMIVATKNNDLGEPVTSVPAEDGTTITINAVKFQGLTAGTYAIEYIKTPATYNNNGGSVFTLADETAFNTEVSTNGKIYTDTDCTTELTWAVYNTDASSKAATYYRRVSVKTVGVYAYKVIKVAAP